MAYLSKPLLAAVMFAAPMLAGAGGIAVAQMRPPAGLAGGLAGGNFDPSQLPEFKGKVAQFTLAPFGMVDGLILDDGTEVQVAPHLSNALVFSVKPGDMISIRGLKARNVAMVSAVTITNIASGAVIGGGPAGGGMFGGPPEDMPKMDVSGKIKALLHTPRGDVAGALLEDGTVLRLPPPEAAKQASLLVVGNTIAARGIGVSGPLGKSIGVLEIGPSTDKLVKIEMPRHHGPRGMMGPEGMMGGKPMMHQ